MCASMPERPTTPARADDAGRRRAGDVAVKAVRRAVHLVTFALERLVADVDDDAWSPAPADLAALHARLGGQWKAWRRTPGDSQEREPH
jgi:hypothetical protein